MEPAVTVLFDEATNTVSYIVADPATEALSGRRHLNLYRTQGTLKRSRPSLDVYSVE